jgi:SAM-dependent MidA family methyltransferase
MSSIAATLPPPSVAALQISRMLAEQIRDEIRRAGGWLDFARFMELALYTPGLGYYSGGSTKIGPAGDFVTAPQLSRTFGRVIAGTLGAELDAAGANTILELGAGTGCLAEQILDALAARTEISYRILEPSAELRARQIAKLERFGARVAWLDRLPERPLEAVIVANEVLDALPVTRFVKRGGAAVPIGVVAAGDGFDWAAGTPQPRLAAAVTAIESRLAQPLAEGFVSEVCLVLPGWLAALGAALARGSVLLVDYGLTGREYYRADRNGGTLLCHYRHRAHGDPFAHPGLNDISAWVDFSACAAAAVAAGLDVAGFTTQAQYLVAALAADPPTAAAAAASIRELAGLKTLLLPGEMGERFKVLLLRKNVEGAALPGRDFRARL